MILVVPADPLAPGRPDVHFAAEAAAARTAGLDVTLVDHDLLERGTDPDRAVARVRVAGPAVYRGWMLAADRYADFERALAARGVLLRTTATGYRRAHELPGWYDALAALTPETVWTTGDDRAGFDAARIRLGGGPAVVRDYTKSMKHHWDEAMYIPDLADADRAWRVAARLRELRGEDFAGGFVLRRFEPFTGAETRTWWVAGRCVLAGAHPDTPGEGDAGQAPTGLVAPLVDALGLPFVTVDLARTADGAWRVVELGDGQVSDRPVDLPADAFVSAAVAV